MAVIEGGALAINDKNINETAIISANQTAEWNKFQAMNNESIDNTHYNGTSNNGPYKEVIKQLNQSVPLINTTTLSAGKVDKKQNSEQQITQNGKTVDVISVMNGTEIGDKAKNNINNNAATISSNNTSQTTASKPDIKTPQQISQLVADNKGRSDIFGDIRTLPVKNDYHNIFIHLKKEGDGGGGELAFSKKNHHKQSL